MIPDLLKTYYSTLDSDFHSLYAGLTDEGGQKNVHALRVNVKKHLAFFRLMASLDKDFPKKEVSQPFRVFRSFTGEQRDLEVGIGLLIKQEKKLGLPADYSMTLLRRHRRHAVSLKKIEEKLPAGTTQQVAKKVMARIETLPGEAGLRTYLHIYFLNKLERSAKCVEAALLECNENALHKLRMHIKELMLNLTVLQIMAPPGPGFPNFKKHLDNLQDLLGDWHDLHVLRTNMEAEGKSVSKKLRNAVRKEEKLCLHQVEDDLKSFTSLHLEALQVLKDLLMQKN